MHNSFENNFFKLNEEGFDFLRNKFVYKHLNFSEIDKIFIKKGHSIKHWIIALILGLVLIIVSIKFYFQFFSNVGEVDIVHANPPINHYGMASVLVAMSFVLLAGIILLYQAFRKSLVIKIFSKKEKIKIPLNDIKSTELQALIQFMKAKNIEVYKEE